MAIFSRNSDRTVPPPVETAEVRTPLRILAERYASGAIGREEFQQIRRDLIDQEALANLAGDPRAAATMDSLALVDTVTPNATLLTAASAFIAGSPGKEASRILAGLIRALHLDGSVFHFDLLERLDPEQRAWAEGLIKAKLERLIPPGEWDRAYDIVRNFEHQTESTAAAGDSAARHGDWDSMLKEAENFLNNSKSKAAPVRDSGEPAGATPAADPPAALLEVDQPAVPREAVVFKLHEAALADPPVPYLPVAEMESYSTVTYAPVPPRKRKLALRRVAAGLAVIGVVVIAFNALRTKPASPPVEVRGGAETAAKTAIPIPAVIATDGRQQSKGQILVAPAQIVAVPEKPIAQPSGVQVNGVDKPAPALPGGQPAVAIIMPEVTPPAASAVIPPAAPVIETKVAPREPVKTVVAAPASRKPVHVPAKAAPTQSGAAGRPKPTPVKGATSVKEATLAQTVAKPAEPAAPTADLPAKPPVQVAALAPALRPAPELRPAPRPDDIEAWSGGEDSLQQGLRNYQSGNYKDAAENLQKALEAGLRVKRNTVTAHKLLALSHCALGRESQCRLEFQQALRIDPSLTLGADEAAVPSAGAAFGSARSAQGK